jgi:hypothetical protein
MWIPQCSPPIVDDVLASASATGDNRSANRPPSPSEGEKERHGDDYCWILQGKAQHLILSIKQSYCLGS